MVDVEHSALRAFKQDAFAFANQSVQQMRGIAHQGRMCSANIRIRRGCVRNRRDR